MLYTGLRPAVSQRQSTLMTRVCVILPSTLLHADEEDRARPKARTPERALYEERAELAVRVKVRRWG